MRQSRKVRTGLSLWSTSRNKRTKHLGRNPTGHTFKCETKDEGDYEQSNLRGLLFQVLAIFKERKYPVSITDSKEFDQIRKFPLKLEAKNSIKQVNGTQVN